MASSAIAARNKRVSWLDYDKGITILLVVFGHCLDKLIDDPSSGIRSYSLLTYMGLFLYGFRMPLFFMVSGILVTGNLQKKGLRRYLGTRTELLYVMMVWGIIQVSLKLLSHTPSITYWSYLDLLIDPRKTGHLWYLNAFFCIGVIYSVTKVKMKLTPKHQLFVGLALYLGSSYILVNDINAGPFTDIGKYYFFFALGDVISIRIKDKKTQQAFASRKFFLFLLLIFLCVQYYCTSINLQHKEDYEFYVEDKIPFLYLVEGLIGCAFSMSLSFRLQQHNRLRWLTRIGWYSLYIYLMHLMFIGFGYNLLHKITFLLSPPGLLFSLWIFGALMPIVVYKLAMRFGFWWLFSFRKESLAEKEKIVQAEPVAEKENMELPVLHN